ncbi:unnamed protein product [Bemisia tabaci]|uniref:Uncharacterized protein n=1 Tax=Bemisia tabaci TaxID=7038 RepID=A0A9P0F0P5_BEMTA|nr:unnamed protein product [Bemisia tabaci]
MLVIQQITIFIMVEANSQLFLTLLREDVDWESYPDCGSQDQEPKTGTENLQEPKPDAIDLREANQIGETEQRKKKKSRHGSKAKNSRDRRRARAFFQRQRTRPQWIHASKGV